MESDEILYRDLRQGSEAAFGKLYAKYERPLFGYILRRIESRQDAEEIFHETMMSLFRGPLIEVKDGSLGAWLFKVALHLSLNRLRSRKRESLAMEGLLHEPKPADEADPCDDEPTLQKLQASVRDLSQPLQQVYELRREGKSYEEISDIAGIPVGTVKSRVHKMVDQLKKDMSKWLAR